MELTRIQQTVFGDAIEVKVDNLEVSLDSGCAGHVKLEGVEQTGIRSIVVHMAVGEPPRIEIERFIPINTPVSLVKRFGIDTDKEQSHGKA